MNVCFKFHGNVALKENAHVSNVSFHVIEYSLLDRLRLLSRPAVEDPADQQTDWHWYRLGHTASMAGRNVLYCVSYMKQL